MKNTFIHNRFPLFSPSSFSIQRRLSLALILIHLCLLICAHPSYAQTPEISSVGDKERKIGKKMLGSTIKELKSKYYDKSLHGMNVEERCKIAEGQIDKATSIGEIYGIVAQVVLELNDSHTYFIPPPRMMYISYGWDLQIIGDECRVTSVKTGSDAEAKGLKVGDEIYSIDGIWLTRENFSRFKYLYNALRPKKSMRVVVQYDANQQREMEIMAESESLKRATDIFDFIDRQTKERRSDPANFSQTHEVGKDLLILRLPSFSIPPEETDKFMKKARGFKSMIIDLRRNPGGYEVTLQRMVGHFFDKDIKIATVKQRDGTKDVIAKTRGKDAFTGQIVVLVDSRSASAAEAFARVIQLEKRGMVLGDRTSGRVMLSRRYSYQVGDHIFILYGLSITVADFIMADGKSLEHNGVTPDELLLPTGADMFARRDPVLARAAQILGVTLDATEAGSLFRNEREP